MSTVGKLIILLLLASAAGCARPQTAAEADAPAGTRFSLPAPGASSVAVAGTFNHWDRHSHLLAGPGPDGRWTITLPLPPGRYEYLYVVNGSEWVRDPSAPFADDGLGGRNSVVMVPDDAGP